MGVGRKSDKDPDIYRVFARLATAFPVLVLLNYTEVKWLAQVHGAGRWWRVRKIHSLCSFHSSRLCLGVVVWIYIPTAGRERMVWPAQYPRPEYKGKSFGWLAQPPAVRSSENLPHGKLSCPPSSEPPVLWRVPAGTACLLLPLPRDQQLFNVPSRGASLLLCSPSAHLLCAAHLHVIEGRLCLWPVIVLLNSPMKWNLKGSACRGARIHLHFSLCLSLLPGPLWLLCSRKFSRRVSFLLLVFNSLLKMPLS